MTRPCDPVGAVEIAARLGVKRTTVDQWRQRRIGFPEPRWTVGGRPAWDWPHVQAWAEARKKPMELGIIANDPAGDYTVNLRPDGTFTLPG